MTPIHIDVPFTQLDFEMLKLSTEWMLSQNYDGAPPGVLKVQASLKETHSKLITIMAKCRQLAPDSPQPEFIVDKTKGQVF